MFQMSLKSGLFNIVVAGLLVVSGCASSEPELPSVDVSGQVLVNGDPFTGAAVRFYSPQLGGGAFNLDDQGKFSSSAPLKVGEYLVSLDRPGANTGEDPSQMSFPKDNSSQLPAKYRSGTNSGLVAQLEVDKENHFVFKLTGKISASGNNQARPKAFKPVKTDS